MGGDSEVAWRGDGGWGEMDLFYLRLVVELGEIPVRGAPDAPCHIRSHLLGFVCWLIY